MNRCTVLMILSLLVSGCTATQHAQIAGHDNSQGRSVPHSLKPFIESMSSPLIPMELPDYIKGEIPLRVSQEQALEDIEVLRYLFDHAFSGRHYWQQHGVDFPAGYNALRRYVQDIGADGIDTRDFEKQIFSTFAGINDPHTAIIGHEVNEFFTRVRQYFARFVVAKQGDRYIVIQSADPEVAVGAEYIDAVDKLFPTLSPTGAQHFLFGKMSSVPLTELTVNLRQGEVKSSVHACRIGKIQYDRFDRIIETSIVNNVPVVRSSSFWVDGKMKELEDFSEYGKRMRNEPQFIWNLLANDGGITQYPSKFIENFNGMAYEQSTEVHLHSTPIAQAYFPGKNTWSSWPAAWLDDATPLSVVPEYKRDHVAQVRHQKVDLLANPRQYWEIVRENFTRKLGDYPGKLVILSNFRNGSAGNNALAMSKSVPNSIIVGENSNMTYTFANTRNFSLKHSRIKLRLPGRLIIHPENSIERGFLPDLWLDSDNPVEEVSKWMSKPTEYQFVYRD